MVGVQPFAWLARVISLLGPIPYFEKARWLDVIPEYNPFKYNSFPANAGHQSWRLSSAVQAQILRVREAGRLKALPPVLAFQSVVDATVSTDAVVHALFDQLADNGSELVLFDINRLSGLEPFIRPDTAQVLSRLTDRSPRRYGRALLTNAGRDSLDVVERSIARTGRRSSPAPRPVVARRDVFAVTRRLAVRRSTTRCTAGRRGRRPATSSGSGPQPARRARGADGTRGHVDAGVGQSVLSVPGRTRDQVDGRASGAQ